MVKDSLGIAAKNSLVKLAKETDDRLKKYWESEIATNFGFNETQRELVKKMLLHSKEHNLRPAKRLRASFVYYGYLLGGNEINEEIWKAAEAVELVHTALLIHDDFMDQDTVRRGLPTTHLYFGEGDSHYGDSMAVNVGDGVLCLGYERLLLTNLPDDLTRKAMAQLLRGIANTAWGQAYDMSLPKLGEITEEKVINLHKAKTAIYTYENPLKIGAILAGLPEETFNILRDYSMDGGAAFQLQDDVLGVYGDEEKTGKSANSDLLQGKVTLLIVKTLQSGSERQKLALQKVWGKDKAAMDDIEEAKNAIKECGAYQYSVEVAREYAEKAAGHASKLRKLKLNSEAIDYLEGIARYMVEREV